MIKGPIGLKGNWKSWVDELASGNHVFEIGMGT